MKDHFKILHKAISTTSRLVGIALLLVAVLFALRGG
jgi:hypothetical protein